MWTSKAAPIWKCNSDRALIPPRLRDLRGEELGRKIFAVIWFIVFIGLVPCVGVALIGTSMARVWMSVMSKSGSRS
jgi:nitrate reductase NapE component